MEQKSIKINSVYSIIKTCSSILFPLLTFPYISRTLLTENVGKINFGLSIINYFTLIAGLGITTYAVRECAAVKADKDKLSNISSQIFSINIFTTFISYILLALTLIFYGKLSNYRLLIVIQSLSIVFTTLGADWLNTAMEDLKFVTIRTVIFQIASLVLMFIFVHKPDDYYKYAAICVISTSGANIVNIWYRKRFCNVRFTKNIEWRTHIAPIMYLFVMILAQTIFNSVDTTMLGLIHGDYEVGIYSTAHKVCNTVAQIVSAIGWVIIPRLSIYFANKEYEKINELLRKVLGFNVLIGFPCVVGTICLSEDIIAVVAGTGYERSAPVLAILMISVLIALFGGNFLGNAILLPSKNEKYYMIVCVITAAVNVVMNYLFIPKYGAIAAAGTTAFSSLVIALLLLCKVDKNIKIKRIRTLLYGPIVGSVAIVGICIIFSRVNSIVVRLILSVGASVIVYFFVQTVLKNDLVIEVEKKVVSTVRGRGLW